MLVHIVKPRYASPTIQLASFSPAKRWGTLFVPLLVGPSTVRHLARTKKDRKGAASTSSLGCLCVCVMFFFFFSERGERNTLKLNSWRSRCSCFGTAQSSSMLRLYRELSSSISCSCVSFLNVCMLVGVCVCVGRVCVYMWRERESLSMVLLYRLCPVYQCAAALDHLSKRSPHRKSI